MAKKRYINTKFWSDTFVVELNPLDRYLFLYLLTNEHTDICGIYELPWRVMARETGLDDDMLQKMFTRLDGKIYYIDGWIYIKNFVKHQAVNESIETGIKRSMALVPNYILAKIKEIDTDWDRLGQTAADCDLLKPKLKPKPKPKLKLKLNNLQPAVAEDNGLITEIMNIFKTINPTINFGHKTNRQAVLEINKATNGKVKDYALYAISVQGQPYAPVITTPYQLKEKLTQLKIFYGKSRQPKKGGITILK